MNELKSHRVNYRVGVCVCLCGIVNVATRLYIELGESDSNIEERPATSLDELSEKDRRKPIREFRSTSVAIITYYHRV